MNDKPVLLQPLLVVTGTVSDLTASRVTVRTEDGSWAMVPVGPADLPRLLPGTRVSIALAVPA